MVRVVKRNMVEGEGEDVGEVVCKGQIELDIGGECRQEQHAAENWSVVGPSLRADCLLT